MTSLRYIAYVLIAALLFSSCEKNTVSKIPYISLIGFYPDTAMKVNTDTCYFYFSITDGDADIAGPGDTVSQIYLKDSRYESQGFIKTPFPDVDVTIEDPKKGLEAKCFFYPYPLLTPRTDSIHGTRDTITLELYIKDRANHESNHIITHPFIIKV